MTNLTKTEQKKQARLLIVKKCDEIENQIKSLQKEYPDFSNLNELLFSVAEVKRIAKTHAEVLRLAEVVCFCGKTKEKDTYFKNLLYSEIKKILDLCNIQQTF